MKSCFLYETCGAQDWNDTVNWVVYLVQTQLKTVEEFEYVV
jgi:hypothetical protein